MEDHTISAIHSAIRVIAAAVLHKPAITFEEVDQIYADGTCPRLNEAIDYVLCGNP